MEEVDIKEGGCPGPSNISFMEEGGWRPNINGMTSETLGSDDVRMLGVLFSKEVFVALSSCCGDKALQSDGFVAVLWKMAWDSIKIEVMNFFKELFDNNSFERSLNVTFGFWFLRKVEWGLERFQIY